MHTTPGKWLVVCVKDARGYTKGQPMNGRERTREDAAARAAAMSDVYPGSFAAMPDDDFYASIDDESVFDKYLPATKADTPPREN
jgi:hypothetical protein